jgi:hypothetical protein
MIKPQKACYLLFFALMCCRKPYTPKVFSAPNSFLVVEGVINSGNDSTIIKLSRTVKLNDKITVNPVLGATVTVESDQSSSFRLFDVNSNGHYGSGPLNLSAVQKYRLRVNTGDGRQYLSDFIAVKPTPPIDSINYTVKDSTVYLFANTHDPSNNTRNYRWDYDETWIFHARFLSDRILDTVTHKIRPRNDNEQIYYCFGNDVSSNVLLFSTKKLKQDVVYESPLTQIKLTSEKFERKYSILVRQYALTDDAFAFFQNLQKNTEQLGSIFDAQPSQLNSNIHSLTDVNEPVIGFLSVTNVQSKRIFITVDELPPYLLAKYPYDCVQDSALYSNKHGFDEVQNDLINPPIVYVPTVGIFASGYEIGVCFSTPICVDCTLRGTKQTPSFWK